MKGVVDCKFSGKKHSKQTVLNMNRNYFGGKVYPEAKGYKCSDNTWLPILICGYMKDIGEIIKSPDKDFIASIIPDSIIKLCEIYAKPKTFRVGDKMTLQNGIEGEIRYIGIPEFKSFYTHKYKPLEIIGIKTRKYYINLGNGIIDNVEYFESKDGFSYFIESIKIWRYYDMIETINHTYSIWKCERVRRDYKIDAKIIAKDIKIGHRVKYKNGLIGDVIFKGDIEIGSHWQSKTIKNAL